MITRGSFHASRVLHSHTHSVPSNLSFYRVVCCRLMLSDNRIKVLLIGDADGPARAVSSCYFDSAPLSLKSTALLERDFPAGRYFVVPFCFWNKRKDGGRAKASTRNFTWLMVHFFCVHFISLCALFFLPFSFTFALFEMMKCSACLVSPSVIITLHIALPLSSRTSESRICS